MLGNKVSISNFLADNRHLAPVLFAKLILDYFSVENTHCKVIS